MADELTATLAAIRDRAGVFAKFGPPRPALGFGSEVYNAAIASAEDAPSLLAAVEAALKEADRLSRKTVKGSPLERIRGECAEVIREAVRAALTAEEAAGGT